MTKYNVHLYTVVRVKMTAIEAENYEQAIEKAEDEFGRCDPNWEIQSKMRHGEAEYAEETVSALVDVIGDQEYDLTTLFDLENGKWVKQDEAARNAKNKRAEIINVIASMKKYGDELSPRDIDGDDAMVTLNGLIEQARQLAT